MPDITDSLVDPLHKQTGEDLMDWEKVLVEAHGDVELAMSSMCIAEQPSASEKNDNFGRNDIITIQKRNDGSATILELNCETDHVAYDSTFEAFASHVARVALEDHISDFEDLRERFKEDCLALSSRLGERIVIRRIAATEGTYTTSYLHYNLHIGVLISGSIASEELLHSVAMHIAVMEPEYIRPEDIPPELVQHEQQKQLEVAMQRGVTSDVAESMVERRMNNFKSRLSFYS